MYLGFLLVFAFITLTFQKTDKLKKLYFILWPAKDALQNNFEATPAYILEELKTKSANHLKTDISAYVEASKNIWALRQSSSVQQFEKA
jgi:hypothetical protein